MCIFQKVVIRNLISFAIIIFMINANKSRLQKHNSTFKQEYYMYSSVIMRLTDIIVCMYMKVKYLSQVFYILYNPT